MTNQERDDINAVLANAMGLVTATSVRPYLADFTRNAQTSRALCDWLATQPITVQDRFEGRLNELLADQDDDLRCMVLYYLTAPMELIAAAAAWAVETEER